MNPKCVAKIAACVAGAHTIEDARTGSPYAVIVARNIFGLQPPPAPILPAPEAIPLPKIMLKGTMSILGSRQALFRMVEPASPDHPARDKS